jgi:hypothetical protein
MSDEVKGRSPVQPGLSGHFFGTDFVRLTSL